MIDPYQRSPPKQASHHQPVLEHHSPYKHPHSDEPIKLSRHQINDLVLSRTTSVRRRTPTTIGADYMLSDASKRSTAHVPVRLRRPDHDRPARLHMRIAPDGMRRRRSTTHFSLDGDTLVSSTIERPRPVVVVRTVPAVGILERPAPAGGSSRRGPEHGGTGPRGPSSDVSRPR